MKKLVLFAVLALASCKSVPGEPAPLDTLCQWAETADAACQAFQPIPAPSPAVRAEILRSAAVNSPAIGTACEYVHLVVIACRAGRTPPAPPAQMARDLQHDDSR